ncbi:hypothetical protein DBT_0444 [Dissulfuribacter thermophilus]|uniref:Uncharacterized protein n=1 Tax=Dissulfuribacter thermophilus TaxID=1156395 RepID=A0A1B9F7T6_9BACT|nr:DUF6508 domain-containing protein [Dissulfuribacter thermophilus]OCC15982.1 hypothetical protein DBT_0444 [Dissulfuribacter thermophilus]
MMIDEKNCKSKIDALMYQDWQPLLALIPEIENTSKFCEWCGGDKNKEGVITFPYSVPAPIVSKFLEIVYAIPIIINFDWGSWDEGRKIASDEGFDFNTIDLVTKCKLITAIVRNDRFCDGALVSAFESGLILKILKSIEKEVSTKGKAD